MKQVNRAELLDCNHGTLGQARASLHDIRRINTYLGGARIAIDPTLRLLRERGLQRATVLDVGTGSADIPLRLVRRAGAENISVQVLALDNNARHLSIAREDLNGAREVLLLQANAFHLPLADNSVDVTLTSLFLHHFRAGEIIRLLREFDRVSRVGWVMNDLVRSYVPLWFFRVMAPIFARSYLTRHDGAASIRRGYTVAEMRDIAARCGLTDVRVRSHLPYRLSLVRHKSEAGSTPS